MAHKRTYKGKHRKRSPLSGKSSAALTTVLVTSTVSLTSPAMAGAQETVPNVLNLVTPKLSPQDTAKFVDETHISVPQLDIRPDGEKKKVDLKDSGSSQSTKRRATVLSVNSQTTTSNKDEDKPSLAKLLENINSFKVRVDEMKPKVAKPAEGSFTSGYGMRWGSLHTGIDIANSNGTPILAVMDGIVTDSGPVSGYGNWIKIKHNDGSVSLYGHMESLYVSVGQSVSAGDVIAGMGNLGFSTGTHLHFEIHLDGVTPVDPVPWFAERGITI